MEFELVKLIPGLRILLGSLVESADVVADDDSAAFVDAWELASSSKI